MKDIEKVQKYSSIVLVLIKVFTVFLYIGLAGCIIGIIGLSICGFLAPSELESNEALRSIVITVNDKVCSIVTVKKQYSLGEIYDAGILNELILLSIGNCVGAIINIVISLVLFNKLKKLFSLLASSERAFDEKILKEMKIALIVLTILIAINNLAVGAIAGLTFACFYYIYRRGIVLQQESDETL